MAKKANQAVNTPESEHVQAAVRDIEERYSDLASERGKYMLACRRIRETIADYYDRASDHGISKKLLKKIIKERDLERRIYDLTADLENDERNELEMLMGALGEFANTPLGEAAIQAAHAV